MNRKIAIPFILVVLYFVWVYFKEKDHNPGCEEYLFFTKNALNGKIINKYLDSTAHGYQMIVIARFEEKDTVKLNLTLDTTNIFTSMDVNDTVIKTKNESSITIKNINKSLSRTIDFGCELNSRKN